MSLFMRPALWTLSLTAILVAACGKDDPYVPDDGGSECSSQVDCSTDQSRWCKKGKCVDVGETPSMELRLSKGPKLNNKNVQSLRMVSVQSMTPKGKTVHCPTLGGQEVTSVPATRDPAVFNVVFEKSFPLPSSGDVYLTAVPMNDDTGVVFAEVFDVQSAEQNDDGISPIGTGCWDRSRAEDKIFECSGNPCITFQLN